MSWPPSGRPGGQRNWRVVTDRVSDPRTRLVAAGVGVVTLVAAVALAAGIGLAWLRPLRAALSAVDGVAVFLAAHFVVALVVWTLWSTRSAGSADVSLPSPRTADDQAVVGSDIDDVLAQLSAAREYPDGWKRVDAEGTVRSLAVEVLRSETDRDADAAATALDEGTWTDDPRAAAFLGTGTGLPVRTRVADWASGEPYRRQLEATVAELAELAGVDASVGTESSADASEDQRAAADKEGRR